MAGKSYIESLWTQEDVDASGLDFQGNFYGNIVQVNSLLFSDGTQMTSAGVGLSVLPSFIDAGTF
jgi:hypothetical protein